jgi:hypothetical protein
VIRAMIVFRFALECGHTRLTGPWDDDEKRPMIGDITFCELCPKVRDYPRERRVFALRQIVQADDIPGEQYREPDAEAVRARHDQNSANI